MDKMRLVGTVTMFFAAVNLMRVVPYFGLGQLNRETLLISLALLPLAIATNFLGFWLVQRIPTEPFYRITYTLMFLISAALLVQGVVGLLRGWAILRRMRLLSLAVLAGLTAQAHAFDLQGHRGARGLAPENTLAGFETALLDRRDDARARPRDDEGRRAGREPRPPAQPGSHARAGRPVPRPRGSADPLAHLRRGPALRRRPAQARHRLCEELSRAAAGRRRPHSGADGAVRPGEAQRRGARALQYRNQDHADLGR